jgi:ketosteroid isomerase-like protein
MSQVRPEVQALADTAYAALNAGDLEGFLALVAEDVEFTSMVLEAEGATFHGHAGVRAWWRSMEETFQHLAWEPLELRAAGETGIASHRIVGTLGGVEVRQTLWQALRLRGGKIAWWGFFRTEHEALEAAGLSE